MSAEKQNESKDKIKLQAVIIAETFNENFQPISADVPPVLLPLANSACLHYTLNWLKGYVDETFIYFKSKFSSQFEESCRPWLTRTYGMTAKLIPLENFTSIGDAMRDLYAKSLIKSDFILLTGNVIGNINLKNLVAVHKKQRKAYSSIVMSSVYLHYLEDWGKEHYSVATLFTHKPSSKLLVHHRPPKDLIIPKKAVDTAKNGGARLLTRMCDPNVLICSEVLPSLFSDNFDYNSKDSLIHGIIGEEDLMGYTINVIDLKEGFCLNIDNFGAFEKMSFKLMNRSVLPLACEKSQSTERMRFTFEDFPLMYYHQSASFSRDQLYDYVMLDAATVVSDDALLEICTIGKHCDIGDGTKISNSFIQNNVKIGENCTMDRCYIADGVKILSGVNLEPGVIVGSNVTIGPNVTVPKRTRVVCTQYDNGYTRSDANIIGNEGRGFIYEPDYPKNIYNCRWGLDLSMEKELEEASSEDESEEELDEVASDDDNFEVFIREVKDVLISGLKETSAENIILEIDASRHANNVNLQDVQKTVVQLVLQCLELKEEESLSGEKLWQSVKQSLNILSPVIKNYVNATADQMTVLLAIEDLICEKERYLPIIQKLLFELNQTLGMLDEEVIIKWFNEENHSEAFPRIKIVIQKFVDWLNEAESE